METLDKQPGQITTIGELRRADIAARVRLDELGLAILSRQEIQLAEQYGIEVLPL